MILYFSILTENKTELFQKFFVEKNYFSEFQVKTLINSTPKLLNIVELISKNEQNLYSSRLFTITNLWVHIIKYNYHFYLFVTPSFFEIRTMRESLEKEYKKLINQMHDLISQCTTFNPHFDLTQNNYFTINTEALLNQFNKFFITHYSKLTNLPENKKEGRIRPSFHHKIGKYLVVGSASAGKSSIIAQFFLNWDQDQIQNIRPTINKQTHNYKDELLNHNFNLIDLGGQVQYTEMHLQDPNLFVEVNNLIYVIDIQDTKKIDFTKHYLLDLISKMDNHKDKPFIAILLHKFDPELQEQLYENVQIWIEWIDKNLQRMDLDYTYYLTSIKDNSAKEAFARTLLLSLPYWFLTLTIKEDLIIRSLNSLSPIIKELSTLTQGKDDEAINKELFTQSVLFGFATTKIITQKWIKHLLNRKEEDNLYNAKTQDENMLIELNKKTSVIDMKFKCPLLGTDQFKDVVKYSAVCEITHGIITGLSQFIGLGSVEMTDTQIRNNSNYCQFKILL